MRLLPILALAMLASAAESQPACLTQLRPLDSAGELRRHSDELTADSPLRTTALRASVFCIADSTARRDKVTYSLIAPRLRLDVAGGLPDSRSDGARPGATSTRQCRRHARLGRAASSPVLVRRQPPFDPSRSIPPAPRGLAFNAGRFTPTFLAYGREPVLASLGQSTFWVSAGPAVGWSSSNLWWGTEPATPCSSAQLPPHPRLFTRPPVKPDSAADLVILSGPYRGRH